MHIEKARWEKESNPPGQAHAAKKEKPGRISARLLRYHYILSREELKGLVCLGVNKDCSNLSNLGPSRIFYFLPFYVIICMHILLYLLNIRG